MEESKKFLTVTVNVNIKDLDVVKEYIESLQLELLETREQNARLLKNIEFLERQLIEKDPGIKKLFDELSGVLSKKIMELKG